MRTLYREVGLAWRVGFGVFLYAFLLKPAPHAQILTSITAVQVCICRWSSTHEYKTIEWHYYLGLHLSPIIIWHLISGKNKVKVRCHIQQNTLHSWKILTNLAVTITFAHNQKLCFLHRFPLKILYQRKNVICLSTQTIQIVQIIMIMLSTLKNYTFCGSHPYR